MLPVLHLPHVIRERSQRYPVSRHGHTGHADAPAQPCEQFRELLIIARKISVTVTMDEREDAFAPGKPHQLFYMSKKMIPTLAELTKDQDEPI